MSTTTMIEIPSNVNVIGWKNKSTPIVQKKKRTVKKYKTPAAVRRKLSAARKKLKVHIVRDTIVFAPVIDAALDTTNYATLGNKARAFYNSIRENYTGLRYSLDGRYIGWDWKKPAATLGSLALLAFDAKYLGARAYANRALGQENFPILRV